VIFQPEKTLISRHILHLHWYTFFTALPVHETCSIEVFWLLFQPLPHLVKHHLWLSNVLERISQAMCEQLYVTNTSHGKHFFMNILCTESFYPQKMYNRMLLFGCTSSSTVAILTTKTSLWTWTCTCTSVDCHEAGLCCYLVIHIENLSSCPLQLLYFHLWPVYWLSLVITESFSEEAKKGITGENMTKGCHIWSTKFYK
jgi:hypothetical protein